MHRFTVGAGAVVFMLSILLSSAAAASELPETNARAAFLCERHTGQVLYAENADTPLPIASTTKIMTCLLALENCRLDEVVTTSSNASGVTGTSIYLAVGEQLTMEEMLYGLMLRSGNDAAVAIAEHIAGSTSAFAAQMNERAASLGADAHFVTPNGLDAQGHAASARAMALITCEALTHEEFRTLVSTTRRRIPWANRDYSRLLVNKNRLLTTYAGALGVKTGFTSRAGRCLVFAAERNGMELVGVVLNCGTWFDTAAKMLDWGFASFEIHTPLTAGKQAGRVSVRGGQTDSVAFCAVTDFSFLTRANTHFSVRYETPTVSAPVAQGDLLGYAYAESGGQILARTALVAQSAVPRRSWLLSLREMFRRWPLPIAD